jgi:chemotaxis protein MotB
MNTSDLSGSDDINIDIEQTVVMISISDKLLFNTASYSVKKGAYRLIEKLANVIKSEPSMDVMIEGHTDSRTISNDVVQDNWDLSVKRATSIVRILEGKHKIDGSRLIASGRGSSIPLVPNTSNKNRAKNRRTRIVILPNLDKFFALIADENIKN